MKLLFASLVTLSIALTAYAHPGKTDRYGGHKCYKECAEWDLYYAEYHLHDKDGRPVKVVKKKPARSAPTTTVAVTDTGADPQPQAPVAAAPPGVQAAMVPDESDLPLMWILLALLLLLLLVIRRRRTEKTDGNDLPS
jgi:MYXO-CTERM domain-containing protein